MKQITLSESEFEALAGLVDAGLKATGLRACRDAVKVLDRLEAAQTIPDEPTPE